MRQVELVLRLCRLVAAIGIDVLRLVASSLRSRTTLAVENLFLFFPERPSVRKIGTPTYVDAVGPESGTSEVTGRDRTAVVAS